MNDVWTMMKNTTLPVVLYGTGNAADLLLSIMEEKGIRISGVFASDAFVRKRTFHSFKVLSYSDARRIFGRMCVVMGFGTQDMRVIESVKKIAAENEFYCPSLLLDKDGSPFCGEYYENHTTEIKAVRDILSDERSRGIYDAVFSYRLTGNIEYLLPVEEDGEESWKELSFSPHEVFVDAGAYNGDTILRFLSLTDGKYCKIIGIEPDRRSFRKAEKNLSEKERITLYNTLLSDKEGKVLFSSGKGRGNSNTENGDERETTTIDELLGDERPTLMKFDVEGEEEKVLEGARRTIEKYKPRLILSVYHRIDDFWRLIAKVKELNRGYSRFILRTSHSIPDWDIIVLIE